jgi:AIPR protein
MTLEEFLLQTHADVRTEIGNRLGTLQNEYPFAELVFAEIVMQHLSDIGMTFEPQMCHFNGKIGNAQLHLTGYALSDDAEQIDFFVSIYDGSDHIQTISDADIKTAAEQCLRFVSKCADGRLSSHIDPASAPEVYDLAKTIEELYSNFNQIRIYVLTDRQAKAKQFKPREVSGRTIKLEVIDIERLHRHWSAGKPRDEIVVNFEEVSGSALRCVYVPGERSNYDYSLTVIPGETLFAIYEKYGARLLEANVRSFLSVTGKVNKGIRDTLRDDPEHFMAYNNGIVIVTDEAKLGTDSSGTEGLLWLKGMQIVNGGQTTASIYFTKKKDPSTDLTRVRVPAKIIVLNSSDSADEERLIADISKFANSQNSVKVSDLSANKPFHVEIEKLALSTYCPDGVSRWFYERATGSYNTLLAREGTTPAQLRKLKESIPPSRRITKTDLAKYLMAWNQKPDLVALGAQKNFERFMNLLTDAEQTAGAATQNTVSSYKEMVSKAILYKAVHKASHKMFKQATGNVVAYTVSVISRVHGDRFDFESVWKNQDISPQLKRLSETWLREVGDALFALADGKMISEWAKKPECWEAVKTKHYSVPSESIPEARSI